MKRINSERPHHTATCNISSTTSATNELFLCFTSRLSSSSMKLSSKSILSPGHGREPSQISLSTSLSRRLRNSGSIKGGHASPMFPTGSKKRGCNFENPEPSSPKVTCIGQIRVKTKKQGKKMRTRSKRMGGWGVGSEASFRKPWQQGSGGEQNGQSHQNFQFRNSQHRNQRWVHLPLTICEALRAFGSEFNCFLPCRSSCMTTEREKEEKAERSEKASSCGAVFARWLVSVQDGNGKEKEIELVVGEEDIDDDSHKHRRQVFDGMEFKDEEKSEIVEEEAARVSICIPPKNALLLMRCRSDPVKMAALANRFWESPASKVEDDVEEEEEEEDDDDEEEDDNEQNVEAAVGDVVDYEEEDEKAELEMELKGDEMCEKWVVSDSEGEEEEDEAAEIAERSQDIDGLVQKETPLEHELEEHQKQEEMRYEEEEQNSGSTRHAFAAGTANNCGDSVTEEIITHPAKPEVDVAMRKSVAETEAELNHEEGEDEEEEKGGDNGDGDLREEAGQREEEDSQTEAMAEVAAEISERSWEDEEKATHERSDSQEDPETQTGPGQSNEQETEPPKQEREVSVLPDCLLLMMCEPKLSMEVSRETWVCSTDFIRRPQVEKEKKKKKQADKIDNGRDQHLPVKRVSFEERRRQPLMQPPRSSCSLPIRGGDGAGATMATMVEQKLVGGKAYEPFVLTRCKSEPMRSAAKLAPEACFWKNRKLEPPPAPATLGVGF